MAAQPAPQLVFNGPVILVSTAEGAQALGMSNVLRDFLRAQPQPPAAGAPVNLIPAAGEGEPRENAAANADRDGVRPSIVDQERTPANSTNSRRPQPASPVASARSGQGQQSVRKEATRATTSHPRRAASLGPCPQLFTGDPSQGSRTLTAQGKTWMVKRYKALLHDAVDKSRGLLQEDEVYSVICKANATIYLDTHELGAVFTTFKTVYCHHLNRERFALVEERATGVKWSLTPLLVDLKAAGKKMGISEEKMDETTAQVTGWKRALGRGSRDDDDESTDDDEYDPSPEEGRTPKRGRPAHHQAPRASGSKPAFAQSPNSRRVKTWLRGAGSSLI